MRADFGSHRGAWLAQQYGSGEFCSIYFSTAVFFCAKIGDIGRSTVVWVHEELALIRMSQSVWSCTGMSVVLVLCLGSNEEFVSLPDFEIGMDASSRKRPQNRAWLKKKKKRSVAGQACSESSLGRVIKRHGPCQPPESATRVPDLRFYCTRFFSGRGLTLGQFTRGVL